MKTKRETQDQSQIKWISDFIWNIADDRLRDVYVRGKYRDVILPFTVLRRLDAVLEETKGAVLERKKFLDNHKVAVKVLIPKSPDVAHWQVCQLCNLCCDRDGF